MFETGSDPIALSGALYEEGRVEVEPGVSLKVMRWTPRSAVESDPVLFVAGWVSVVEGWAPLLEAWVPHRTVIYLETREKRSAHIDSSRMRVLSFTIPRLAEDLVAAVARLEIDPARMLLFGSSMGSNAILEGLKHGRLGCRAAFVIGANSNFAFPWWGRLLTYMPAAAYHPAKYMVLWYLRRYRVNAREDPEQMARYDRTLRAADALRMKLSARAVLDYTIWPGLETITAPVAVAYARCDTLHGEAKAARIAEAMPTARAVSCPSNSYMHRAEVLDDVHRFLAELQ